MELAYRQRKRGVEGSLPFYHGGGRMALSVEAIQPCEVALADSRVGAALITSTHGKGKVVFMPLDLGGAYFRFSMPYLRYLLKKSLLWASRTPPPVTVEGQLILQTAFYEQPAKRRVVVHLLNDYSSVGRPGHNLDMRDVTGIDPSYPLREEVIPLRDIRVKFDTAQLAVRRITLQPDGIELEVKRDKNVVTVTVPLVKVHAILVAECAAP